MIVESHSPARSSAGRAVPWETINLALERGARRAHSPVHTPPWAHEKVPTSPFLERSRVPKLGAECPNPSSPLGSKETAYGTAQEHLLS
jgi:hypothetical protein